jgi:DNA-binding IclR family transcriptional regulator
MGVDHDEERKYRAPALEKGLDVLELLAQQRDPLSMSQISASLDRSLSELFRMVQILQYRGYVQPSRDGEGLVLTDKLFTLGMTRAPTRSLLEAALPVMRRLAQAIGQSCHLVIASGDQIVVVARVETPGELGFSLRLGYRRPFVLSTAGLVFYGFATSDVQNSLRERLQNTVEPDVWSEFTSQALLARTEGYVRSPNRLVKQILDFSSPIIAGDVVVATLVVPYVETSIASPVDETVARLKAATMEIGAVLAVD